MERRLITSALPYTNNVPHLGNIVGSHLPADIFARYCRLSGFQTVFIGGTDEHGTASEIAAQKYGITPKALCDFYYKIHKDIYDWFNISYDNFSRTSKPIHYKTTQEFIEKIKKHGYIMEKTITLPFCKEENRQLSDRYIEGTCPHCGYDKAKGDQCESCGTMLDPEKLKSPKCAVCGSSNIEFREKTHLFLDLEKLSPKLEKWIKSSKWREQVKALAMGWINEGLKPRCITRNLKWGIPVQFKGFEDLVYYVWVDAPIGYISSTKEWSKTKWKSFWQKKGSKIYHFVGKDNIPFHTIFFPGMIMANGEFNLPHNVVGLQYLNFEGGKFSKSQSRGVFCENLASTGLSPDYWRYYSTYLIPETKDTEFYWKEFQDRVNNELVGNLGNFVNRSLTFIASKYGNKVPKAKLNAKDKTFLKQVEKQTDIVIASFEKVELRAALEETMRLSSMANKYFQDNEPWKEPEKSKNVLYVCANMSRMIALLVQPFLPQTSEKILKMLNATDQNWKKINKLEIKPNQQLNKIELLFHKLEDKEIEELKQKTSKVTEYFKERLTKEEKPIDKESGKPLEERSMMKQEVKEMKKEEHKEPASVQMKVCEACNHVSYNDFKKLDIRVGKVIKAEPHPNAEKLVILLVSFGKCMEPRQIVAGIKKFYPIEKLMGRKIIVITNLQPVVLRGIESNGMLLAASDSSKEHVVLLAPEHDIDEGSIVE
ncbi:MAG TPA: methionine--tRNA ligase [Nanoarchaeota archaeon]|nr:methionine--tRNA ligase [Nanoarchaeota archaeon]